MSKVIIVDVSPAGEVNIEAKGYTGKSCVEATAFLEKALGQRTSQTKTSDYYKKETEQRKLTNG